MRNDLTLRQACQLLAQQDNLGITTHIHPDGDTIGSAAALCRMLRKLGKTCFVMRPEKVSDKYAFLLDGLTSPDDFTPAFLVSVDTASDARLEYKATPPHLAIDHHRVCTITAPNRLIQSSDAACGQIVFDMLAEFNMVPDNDIATAIYVAISTDTGCFKFSNTTSKTHIIAANLIECGVDTAGLNYQLFMIKSKTRFLVERELNENLNFHYDNRVCVVHICLEMAQRLSATDDDLDNMTQLTQQVEGVEIGVLIRQISPGECKISLRSQNIFDVSAICAGFGGGGHKNAAGYTAFSSIEEAEKQLIERLGAFYA